MSGVMSKQAKAITCQNQHCKKGGLEKWPKNTTTNKSDGETVGGTSSGNMMNKENLSPPPTGTTTGGDGTGTANKGNYLENCLDVESPRFLSSAKILVEDDRSSSK